MPELAEVEFYRRQWDAGLRKRILRVALHGNKRVFRHLDVEALARHLTEAELTRSMAHGKQMLFRTSRQGWVGIHLGMTGELRTEKHGFEPGPHDHLVLHQESRALVFSDARLFGLIRFHEGRKAPAWWRALPPALTSPRFTRDRLMKYLLRHRTAPLKAVLLSQSGFPGVGNWMADEILWRAGLHPRHRAAALSGPATSRLFTAIRSVCTGAVRHVSPAFADPPSTWLFRHRWESGGRCPKDGTLLERATIGGRTTAWCSRCQPAGQLNRGTGRSRKGRAVGG